MPEFDDSKMDLLLRQAMREPAPQLPSGFDRQLARRLKPKRLDQRGRRIVAGYAVVAVVLSAWALAPMPAWAIAAALLAAIASLAISWAAGLRKA